MAGWSVRVPRAQPLKTRTATPGVPKRPTQGQVRLGLRTVAIACEVGTQGDLDDAERQRLVRLALSDLRFSRTMTERLRKDRRGEFWHG